MPPCGFARAVADALAAMEETVLGMALNVEDMVKVLLCQHQLTTDAAAPERPAEAECARERLEGMGPGPYVETSERGRTRRRGEMARRFND